MRRRKPELWKGVVAGAAAGLAAAWVMNQFQTGWGKAKKKLQQRRSGQEQEQEQTQEQSQDDSGESEDATMKTAGGIARKVFGKELTSDQKKKLGPYIHYGFGTLMGAVYGGLSERYPYASAGWGSGFGSALFLGADEIAVSLFHLGSNPKRTPLSAHAYAWASHLVYGVALESVRRPARSALGYSDLQGRTRKAARQVYERISEFAEHTRRRSKSQWKSGLKSAEKAFRRMRKAA